MKVQEALLSDGSKTWLVLDNNYQPIVPVMQYLKYLHLLQRSPNTQRAYAIDLKLYWEFLEYHVLDWTEITVEQLAEFVHWLRMGSRHIAPSQESTRSEKTINRILGTVSLFYEFHEQSFGSSVVQLTSSKRIVFKRYKGFLQHAVKQSYAKRQILKLKEPKRTPGALREEEIKQLVDACTTLQQRFLFCLLYETGLRIGEALNLFHEDLETSGKNVVHVVDRNCSTSINRNKSHRSRKIDVRTGLMRLYSHYLIDEYPETDEFSNYIFVRLSEDRSRAPMPLPYTSIQSFFRSLSRKTGIHVTPHLLRHTHATELIRAGVNIAYVQNRLGHAQIQTTVNTYTHLTHEDMSEVYRNFREQREIDGHSNASGL